MQGPKGHAAGFARLVMVLHLHVSRMYHIKARKKNQEVTGSSVSQLQQKYYRTVIQYFQGVVVNLFVTVILQRSADIWKFCISEGQL